MGEMRTVYAQEPFPLMAEPSIFLAGPTPRRQGVQSWRPEALKMLDVLGFEGLVIVPEPRDGVWSPDYHSQYDWEHEGLERAVCIAFWIARSMATMPALTTNDEWGAWKASGKVVLGVPEWAEHVRYQLHYAAKLKVPTFTSLATTLRAAIEMVAARKNFG